MTRQGRLISIDVEALLGLDQLPLLDILYDMKSDGDYSVATLTLNGIKRHRDEATLPDFMKAKLAQLKGRRDWSSWPQEVRGQTIVHIILNLSML